VRKLRNGEGIRNVAVSFADEASERPKGYADYIPPRGTPRLKKLVAYENPH
jgi:hypothetical protein